MSWKLLQWGSEWDDFLSDVAPDDLPRLLTWVEKLSEHGHKLRTHVKPLGKRLFELKINACRCMYGFHGQSIVLVVCFIKKKQRDQKMIKLARSRLAKLESGEVEIRDVTIH